MASSSHPEARRPRAGRAPLLFLATAALVVSLVLAGALLRPRHPTADVVVTSSYLECAVRALAGDSLTVSSLAPPGSCPGHFDLSPSQARQVRRCRLVLLFDFQRGLEARLGTGPRSTETAAIPLGDGMLLPATALATARRVAEALARAFPEQGPAFDAGLARLASDMAGIEEELNRVAAAVAERGLRAIASQHQAAFCRRLGLEVVAELSSPDEARLSQLQECLARGREAGVAIVVANLQEGEGPARAVAEALGAPLVVLSNFPSLQPGEETFPELVRANLERLQGVPLP